jgi:zinc finger protein RME1
MSSYPQSSTFLFPNTQQTLSYRHERYYTSPPPPPCIEGNYYSSVPLDIPCTRDRNLLTDDYLLTTPLASPPDLHLGSQHEASWGSHQQDIAAVLFGATNDNVASSRYSVAHGLEPAHVLSSSWPGHTGAADGGYLSLDTTPGSLSTSQSDLSGGLPVETPPSDLDGATAEDTDVFSLHMMSPFLSPYLQPRLPSAETTSHNPSPTALFDPLPSTPPDTEAAHVPRSEGPQKCGILALLMANPAMWRQATLSKKGTYVCSHCTSLGNPRKFSNLAALAAHFDHHEVMRLCKCDYTSCVWSLIGFSSMPEKMRHLRSQHSNKHYKCGACQRAFLRGDSLKRHLRLVHGQEHTTAAEINEMTVMGPFEPTVRRTSTATSSSNRSSTKSPPPSTYEPVFDFLCLTP